MPIVVFFLEVGMRWHDGKYAFVTEFSHRLLLSNLRTFFFVNEFGTRVFFIHLAHLSLNLKHFLFFQYHTSFPDTLVIKY